MALHLYTLTIPRFWLAADLQRALEAAGAEVVLTQTKAFVRVWSPVARVSYVRNAVADLLPTKFQQSILDSTFTKIRRG